MYLDSYFNSVFPFSKICLFQWGAPSLHLSVLQVSFLWSLYNSSVSNTALLQRIYDFRAPKYTIFFCTKEISKLFTTTKSFQCIAWQFYGTWWNDWNIYHILFSMKLFRTILVPHINAVCDTCALYNDICIISFANSHNFIL